MMSASVNLIPLRRMQARHRDVRVRRWIVITVAYVALLVVGCGVTDVLWSRPGRAISEELTALDRQLADLTRQISLVQPELAEGKSQLEASRAVAIQPDWSLLLALLSRLRGDSVVLERCVLTPELETSQIRPTVVNASAGGAVAATAKPPPSMRKSMHVRLELKGLGRTNHDVSRFVLNLEQSGLFDSVRLMETVRAPFGTGHAVSFRVHCFMQERQEGQR